MFDKREPRIFYNAKLLRIMIALQRAHVLAQARPSAALFEKSAARLDAEKKAGRIAHFEIFADRLLAFWQRLAGAQGVGVHEEFTLTLASAAPSGTDLFISRGAKAGLAQTSSGAETVLLSVADPQKRWRRLSFNTFKFAVRHELMQQKIKGFFDPAALHYAYLCLVEEGLLTDFALVPDPSIAAPRGPNEPFRLTVDAAASRITLILFDPLALQGGAARQQLFGDLARRSREVFPQPKDAAMAPVLLQSHIRRTLSGALTGPERLGLDLPSVILAAYRLPSAEGHAAARRAGSAELLAAWWRRSRFAAPASARLPFQVAISADGLSATVSAVNGLNAAACPGARDEEWWRDLLEAHGVKFGVDWQALREVTTQIRRGERLSPTVVARGRAAFAAADAELSPVMGRQPVTLPGTRETIDFHEAGSVKFFRAGDLVARVEWSTPAHRGCDVRGQPITPPPAPAPFFDVGAGIVARGAEFFASRDGTVEIEGRSLRLRPALLVDGDVNLTSGDLAFEGPIEIKGNVEAGASVAGTDVLIHGTVGGARVSARRKLCIMGGAVNSVLWSRGDLSAGFIENTRVVCHGSLWLSRGITGGAVSCQKSIVAKGEFGLISGARVHCWHEVICRNLGRESGAETIITMGTRDLWVAAHKRRKARHQALRSALVETRAMLRSILSRSDAQLTRTHLKVRTHLTGRLANLHALAEKMEAHAEAAHRMITTNPRARIHVIGLLAHNVRITMGDVPVAVAGNVKAVTVQMSRGRGENVIALDLR